ncbi:hypothetical protein [Streptomyces rubiginosohelvolus]|uniref:WYL domain-containing protein n=1 Tax=Streptomyces rubiginosohelvolus TaxID=67362 RepID=UPI0033A84444
MMSQTPSHPATAATMSKEAVSILYVNYRGEKGWRTVRPLRIWFGSTEWHPGNQWLMDAVDLEKGAERSFALKDVQGWEDLEA